MILVWDTFGIRVTIGQPDGDVQKAMENLVQELRGYLT